MNYICMYLFLRVKDGREFHQINPVQTLIYSRCLSSCLQQREIFLFSASFFPIRNLLHWGEKLPQKYVLIQKHPKSTASLLSDYSDYRIGLKLAVGVGIWARSSLPPGSPGPNI